MKLNSIGLLPNFRKEEFGIVRKLLSSEFSDDYIEKQYQVFSNDLSKLFEIESSNLLLLDSARSAFFLLLDSLEVPETAEVILPSFTCVVLVNPVQWAGLTPVYVDIDTENFSPSIDNYIAAVTKHTKLIIVQHTFGMGVNVLELRKRLRNMGREDVIIVEDLAHCLGGTYPTEFQPPRIGNEPAKKFGQLADFAIVTFGFEKSISTLRGGALVANDTQLAAAVKQKISENYAELQEYPQTKVKALLQNARFWELTLPVYFMGIWKFTAGRALGWLGHKFGLLGLAIEPEEYSGGMPSEVPAKFPKKLAPLGVCQLNLLQELNSHREQLVEAYSRGLSESNYSENSEQESIRDLVENSWHGLLRYPLVLESEEKWQKVFNSAKSEGFVLGDWYRSLFYTKPEFLINLEYKAGTAKQTEGLSKRIINLPTSINTSRADAEIIIDIIKNN